MNGLLGTFLKKQVIQEKTQSAQNWEKGENITPFLLREQ